MCVFVYVCLFVCVHNVCACEYVCFRKISLHAHITHLSFYASVWDHIIHSSVRLHHFVLCVVFARLGEAFISLDILQIGQSYGTHLGVFLLCAIHRVNHV